LCGDFEDTGKYISKDTLVYADPPYRDSIVDYRGGFDDKEQLRLITFLKDMSDRGALISESNKEIGDGFWKNNFNEKYNIYEYNTKYTAGRGTTVTKAREVLITNYAPLEESDENK
jgi:DNA adenine methylase